MTADPATLPRLSDTSLFSLECQAHAEGWDEIVHMCRDERQRRQS